MDRSTHTWDSWGKYLLCLVFMFPQEKKVTFSILEMWNFTETHDEILFAGRQGMKAGVLDNE